jgi:hypothetical protein
MLKFNDKEADRKAARVLRVLGFRPNQIFKYTTLEDKARVLFQFLSPKERRELADSVGEVKDPQEFFTCINDLLNSSDMMEIYYRFVPMKEIDKLRESEDARHQ